MKLREEIKLAGLALVESVGEGPRRVRAVGLVAGVVNANGRRYPREVVAGALGKLKLSESAGSGRLLATGEAEHPSDKGRRPSLLETVVKWEAASLDAADRVLLEGVILDTVAGRDIRTLLEAGVPVGVSIRGYGEVRKVTEGRRTVQEVTELTITGWDLVSEPSFAGATIYESEGDAMSDELKEGAAGSKALQELLEKERSAGEALRVQLEEAKRAQVELAERKASEALETAIGEATKALPYGAEINGEFVRSVRAAKPTVETLAALVESKRKEYDALMAKMKLAAMGLKVGAPVFESETGRPAWQRPAWELTESVRKADNRPVRDLSKGESRAEVFATRYLEMFDRQYKAQLMAESRVFEEAEATSDLNLPYSVMRSIVEQVWPEVVAANIFDFGVATQSPERMYFESYAGESGATATITDEAVTGDHGNWVELAHERLNPGTVVLTSSPAGTTYTHGVDYVIDYGKGWIKTLATGATTDGQSLLIDYTYEAMRKGESGEIERAKNTLSYKTLEIAADRMATQITSEAIVFSRSQLGYDALGRTLANLVRNIQRKIDKDILYLALASALQQASNSGGTWTSANDAVSLLVKYMGVAKVKIENRYYQPTAFVMSKTNGDALSNWDGFTRDGFPNAVLSASGYAGGVKGLPIFTSAIMPDSHVLVVNRELVMHRVFQAMTLKGPFPTYSNGKLVAADQYYVEEYNGTDAPVVEKASYVSVA